MSDRMRIIATTGVTATNVPDAGDRTTIGQHANAVRHFLDTGDTAPLRPFEDTTVEGHRLQVDPDALEAWAFEGEVEFEDIYDMTGR